jgi:hypothetical protein
MLGNAFLSRQQDVMDAVQRYLRSNAQIIVSGLISAEEGPGKLVCQS